MNIRILLTMVTVLSVVTTPQAYAAFNIKKLSASGGGYTSGGYTVPPESSLPPKVPGSFKITYKDASTIRMEWWDPSKVEDGLRIFRQTMEATTPSLIAQLGPVTKRWGKYKDNDSLLPDTRYCYYVEAYNEHGASRSAPACGFTDRKPGAGFPITSLRLLTYNIFGFDDDNGTGGTGLWGFLANHCEQRTSTLGENIANATPAYDIVAVQEYYDTFDFDTRTCDSGPFRAGIESTGRYTYDDSQFLFQPSGGDTVWEMDGGLGVFSMHPIVFSESEQWIWYCKDYWTYEQYVSLYGVHAVSEEEFQNLECLQDFLHSLLQGVSFSRIELADADLTIDTYVVHTYATGADGCGVDCHTRELEQLAEFIAHHSADSGNPVVVMGDFNIPGPPGEPGVEVDLNDPEFLNNPEFEEYRELRRILGNPQDLHFKYHPTRAGYTRDNCWWGLPRGFVDEDHPLPNDQQGPCADKSSRIDYILVLTDPRFTSSPYEFFVRNRDDVKVVSWSTGWLNVSDHYGLEATVEVRKPLTVSAPYVTKPPATYYASSPAPVVKQTSTFYFGSATLK
jgi:hypothetical protein